MSARALLAGVLLIVLLTCGMCAADADWSLPGSDHTYNDTQCAHLHAVAVGEGFPPGVSEDAAVEHALHC